MLNGVSKSYPSLHSFDRVTKIIFSFIIVTIASQIKIFLPFSPVPITGQTFGIFLVSLLFGKESLFSIFLFIVLGVLGLPLFAVRNIFSVFSPTYGYIIGFLISSFIIVNFKEHFKNRMIPLLIFCNLIIYLLGSLYLYIFFLCFTHTNLNFSKILNIGVFPFIFGDLLKDFFVLLFYKIYSKNNTEG